MNRLNPKGKVPKSLYDKEGRAEIRNDVEQGLVAGQGKQVGGRPAPTPKKVLMYGTKASKEPPT